MSYIVAIDVGIKNLGLCIFDFRISKVVVWENVSLVSSGRYVPSNNVSYVRDFVRKYEKYLLPRRVSSRKGSVGAEHAVSGTSWSALTLEAGKSPTEVPRGRHVPMAPPSAISEFASPSSPSWSLNYALLETSADKVVHHQGARARRARQSTY